MASTTRTATNSLPPAPQTLNAPLPIDGPNIHNVVAGVNLNCLIDLKVVALYARNADYKPKRFQAVVLRRRDPRCTALVFHSGKMQLLGTKSVADAKLAARKFARMIQKLGFNVRLDGFNVQNIVANADFRVGVRLEGFNEKHYPFANWHPELFPGCIYKIRQPDLHLTALVFHLGKVVILGAKREKDIQRACELLYPAIREFPLPSRPREGRK